MKPVLVMCTIARGSAFEQPCQCNLLVCMTRYHLDAPRGEGVTSCLLCLQTQELQDKIDNHDPSLFEGEADPPEEPDVIESLLEGVLPGTAGYVAGAAAQRDSYMMDILPEGDEDGDE